MAVAERVQRHRDRCRAAGLRLVQIWIPDTRRPGFTEECRRQSALVAGADAGDTELMAFLDDALEHVEGWHE